ncbi:ribosome rescue GTPase HflX [Povalibacter sp.]|uniref:ribosome rescue GTPase HflX n=1 Tax=Povalibacter sp. TaxID=1962978 RepID=UPI002F412BEC
MFERPRSGERALLVRIGFGQSPSRDELSELESLATSAGAEVLGVITGTRRSPDPRLFVGSGKADEIHDAVKTLGADLVVFDHPLSPSQERNLEALLQCRVIDRTGLILDIFAQRARTFEGQLQVELAQLRHVATRLVRGWTHLERQKGGIGLRGPGETQLETDRRLLGNRIKTLNARLEKVLTQRETTRRERKRAEIPTVALVGYTNAGKSTLFNRLTGAEAYAADQLFATLDPTVRRLELPDARFALLADTVGFVRDLPHELVAAFRSTLQEAREATLLLHVVDAADPERGERIEQVNRVLDEVGAGSLPQLEIYNKADLVGETPRIERGAEGRARRIWVSAQTGAGTDLLVEAIGEFLGPELVHGHFVLDPRHGRARARFFAAGAVLSEHTLPNGETDLEISMPRRAFEDLCRTEGLPSNGLDPSQTCATGEPFLQSPVSTRWFS